MFFSIIYSAEAAEVSIDPSIDSVVTSHNGSSPTVVFISDQTGYAFYRDAAGSCVYSKTTNGAAVWSESVTVDSQTDCFKIALWYDRWTPGDTTGTSIYILTMDTADLWYTQLDTAGDTLSTTINATGANQAGGFAVGANIPSITKGTDGDLYMGVQDTADAFVIKCAFGSDCAQAINWTEAGTNAFDLAPDWLVLMPLPAGNIMAIRWDISADLLQSKVYNDSGNSWDVSWDTIDLNAIENTTYDGHFGATLRKSNGDIYLAYVADVGTFGNDDDIRAAIYSSGIWTLKTDVVTNSTKGVTGVKLGFNEIVNEIYAVYTARTTPGTAATGNIYWKKSTDGMASWGAEQGPVNTSAGDIYGTRVNAMSDERIYVTWDLISVDDLLGNTIVSTTPPPPPPIPPPPPPVPPGPPPPPSPSDGGSATPITQITFAGQAYPESTIEVSKKRAQDDFYDTVHADYILIHEDGRFEINEIGIAGGEYFYLLQIKDKDERKTTMSFDANLINQTNFSVKNIFAPPTLSLKKTLLARIEDLELQGYAAPRSV
ncbi:MAG: hypothetical protein Q8P35_00965, partial [Candidatus Yanofskybacteria bacterium]|nr:hypothetical protein [Candidatus Yanofskybacteria bacterium]